MACVTSGSSGATSGAKRATALPSRFTRNFSKFHAIALQFFVSSAGEPEQLWRASL